MNNTDHTPTPHSPLPWEAHDVAQCTYIRHSFGDEIGAMRSPDKATQHANAELIVQAVNERASLLREREALRQALQRCVEANNIHGWRILH